MSPEPIATPAPASPEPPKVEPTATEPVNNGKGKTFTEAEVEQLIKDRLEREKAKAQKDAEAAAKKAAEEEAKKNQEWQKLAEQRQKDLEKAQADLSARDLRDRKVAIAKEIGVPESLASRLVGSTDEELKADARALLETLPKTPKPQPGPVITNPGAGGTTGKTAAERLRELHYGEGGSTWDPASLRQRGGGAG